MRYALPICFARFAALTGLMHAQASAQEILQEFFGWDDQWFLSRVGVIPDADGDGLPDILLGAPGAQEYPGKSGGALWIASSATGQPILPVIYGPHDYDYGYYVRAVGDFDGDGVVDFGSGVPDTGGTCITGEANMYSGVDGSLLARIPAPPPLTCQEEAFGNQVVELGDLDRDGFSEVAVTAYWDPIILIVGGPVGGVKRVHRGESQGGLGEGLTGIAKLDDIDGDGVSDYVIGYSRGTIYNSNLGLVVVHSGASGDVIHWIEATDEEKLSGLGKDVAAMGDVDLDGIPDFAAVLPYNSWDGCPTISDQPIAIRIYSGADASILREIRAPFKLKERGGCPYNNLLGGSDINGDGIGDLLASLAIITYYPPLDSNVSGATAVYSGATGTMLWRVRPGSGFRGSMAHMGDVDGDGFGDFGVGFSKETSVHYLNGKVTIHRGAAGDAYRICEASTNSAGTKATLYLEGPISIGNNALDLRVEGALPGATGVFLYGRHDSAASLEARGLCIGATPFLGFPRIGTPVVVEADGTVYVDVDMTLPPLAAGPFAWEVGSTWTVQFRYSDAQSPKGFAVSDAFEITFTP